MCDKLNKHIYDVCIFALNISFKKKHFKAFHAEMQSYHMFVLANNWVGILFGLCYRNNNVYEWVHSSSVRIRA